MHVFTDTTNAFGNDPTRVSLVDVNGDGKADVVYLPGDSKAWIFLGFTDAPQVSTLPA